MNKIDETKLRAMSAHERHTIWKRARGLDTAEAKQMAKKIEELGLPYSDDASLRLDDPICRKMSEIIYSAQGKAAGLESTEMGLPAMAGIDPLLSAALGVDYGSHNDGTVQAGYLVAQMMRTQGYKNSGRKGGLPPNCVAKTAEIFVHIK